MKNVKFFSSILLDRGPRPCPQIIRAQYRQLAERHKYCAKLRAGTFKNAAHEIRQEGGDFPKPLSLKMRNIYQHHHNRRNPISKVISSRSYFNTSRFATVSPVNSTPPPNFYPYFIFVVSNSRVPNSRQEGGFQKSDGFFSWLPFSFSL